MKTTRILPLAAVCSLFLAGCAGTAASVDQTYGLAIDRPNPQEADALANAAMRVVERRLDAMGVVNAGKAFSGSGNTAITVTVPDQDGADELTRQLTAPFDMAVMKQTASGATADVTVEKFGGFSKTDIVTGDFVGVEVGQDTQKVTRARILMTDAGRQKLAALFKAEAGKNIGIFVRGKLISQLAAKADAPTDDIQINGIPNLLIAEAFADDVNVGLHVTFTPRP